MEDFQSLGINTLPNGTSTFPSMLTIAQAHLVDLILIIRYCYITLKTFNIDRRRD